MGTIVSNILLFPTKLQHIIRNASVCSGNLMEIAKLVLPNTVSFYISISNCSSPYSLTIRACDQILNLCFSEVSVIVHFYYWVKEVEHLFTRVRLKFNFSFFFGVYPCRCIADIFTVCFAFFFFFFRIFRNLHVNILLAICLW